METIETLRPTQDDMNDINMKLTFKVLERFIADLESECFELKEMEQDNNAAIYLPQLYTELNGTIDWTWSATHICSFVRAFGKPFPGAFTFYANRKIQILESEVESCETDFHPFYIGRIIGRIDKKFVKVVTGKDLLIIKKIKMDEDAFEPAEKLRLSQILYTPENVLPQAKTQTRLSLNMQPPKEYTTIG